VITQAEPAAARKKRNPTEFLRRFRGREAAATTTRRNKRDTEREKRKEEAKNICEHFCSMSKRF
jgi:hypothetical protein